MKDDKILVTGDDLHISTRVIYFARWPVNGIGGGQDSVVSTRASSFTISNFELDPCAQREAYDVHVYT